MTIRTKLIFAFCALLVMSLAQGTYVLYSLKETNNTNIQTLENALNAVDSAHKIQSEFGNAQQEIDQILSQSVFITSKDALAVLNKHCDNLLELIAALSNVVDDKTHIEKTTAQLASWHELVASYMSGDNLTAIPTQDNLSSAKTELTISVNELTKKVLHNASLVKANSDAALEQTTTISIVLILIVFGIATAVAYFISQSLSTAINKLSDTMDTLAEGKIDISIPFQNRSDEIGKMAHSLNYFQKNEQDRRVLLKKQKEDEQALQDEKQKQLYEREQARLEEEKRTKEEEIRSNKEKRLLITNLVEEFKAVIDNVMTQIKSQSEIMTDQANTVGTSAEKSSAITIEADHLSNSLAENLQDMLTATYDVNDSVNQMRSKVVKSSEIAKAGVIQSQETTNRMEVLEKSATRVNEVIQMIEDIAEKTNLLALNATIEATRAGEAGKGFVIVASEVKALANQTRSATSEIEKNIAEMLNATNEAGASIRSVNQTILEMDNITVDVFQSLDEQESVVASITHQSNSAADMINNLTGHVSTVRDNTQSNLDRSNNLQTAARNLSKTADDLNSQSADFVKNLLAN